MARLRVRSLVFWVFTVLFTAGILFADLPGAYAASGPTGSTTGHQTSTVMLSAKGSVSSNPTAPNVIIGPGGEEYPAVCHWVYKPGYYVTNTFTWAVDTACAVITTYKVWIWGWAVCAAVGEVVSYVPGESYNVCT